VKDVLESDLKDVKDFYHLTEAEGHGYARGKDVSNFWVAEVDGKVIGSIGIRKCCHFLEVLWDKNADIDPFSAQ
jgi:hypothetical protein